MSTNFHFRLLSNTQKSFERILFVNGKRKTRPSTLHHHKNLQNLNIFRWPVIAIVEFFFCWPCSLHSHVHMHMHMQVFIRKQQKLNLQNKSSLMVMIAFTGNCQICQKPFIFVGYKCWFDVHFFFFFSLFHYCSSISSFSNLICNFKK